MHLGNSPLQEYSNQLWDVIVIGTGMGGATIGYELAEAGFSVLFLEKGERLIDPKDGVRGVFPESHLDSKTLTARELQKHGRCSSPLTFISNKTRSTSVPFVGEGSGGSSLLYGMVFERFHKSDFTPRVSHRNHPDLSRSALPEEWPISWEQMTEFYDLAEQLYETKKGADVPVDTLSPSSQEFFHFFKNSNLSPYVLPRSRELLRNCRECQGFLCPLDCKNDASKMCLRPALTRGAHLLTSCEVVKLISAGPRIEAVICNYQGRSLELKGTLIVLACGAVKTPELLIRSKSPEWPTGLGNSSGLVGRNLMRHFFDLYIVFPKHSKTNGLRKEIGFNDWYVDDEQKLGTVQAFGKMPSAQVILSEMEMKIKSLFGRLGVLAVSPFKPLMRWGLDHIFERGFVFVSLVEDLPFPENRVAYSEDETQIISNVSNGERTRIELMRQRMKHLLRPYYYLQLKSAEDVTRLAHTCGTCRMGNDPKTAVVDANNKVHGIDNLYIVDTSFFPSSSGTNPGLTTVANAIRVARHLVRSELKRSL